MLWMFRLEVFRYFINIYWSMGDINLFVYELLMIENVDKWNCFIMGNIVIL